MIDLSVTQLAFIGAIASALVIALRFLYELAAKQKFAVPDWVMVVIVYVASFLMAVWLFPQTLPAWPAFGGDPAALIAGLISYIGNLLVVLTAYSASATLIYTVMLQKVKDGLSQAFLPKLYAKN